MYNKDKVKEIILRLNKEIKNGEHPGVKTDEKYEERLNKDPSERERRIKAALKYIRENRNG